MVPLMVLLHLLRYLDNPDHVMSSQHWPKSPSTHSFNFATLIKGSSGTARLVLYNTSVVATGLVQVPDLDDVDGAHHAHAGIGVQIVRGVDSIITLSRYHAITRLLS